MKYFILLLLSMFLFSTSCNKKEISKKDNVELKYDSNLYKSYEIDTIKIITLKEFKSSNLYTKHCKFCHGNEGKGDGIKSRTREDLCPFDLSKENKSDNEVYYIILNGKNNMPNQKELKDKEIKVLVIYIKKFR